MNPPVERLTCARRDEAPARGPYPARPSEQAATRNRRVSVGEQPLLIWNWAVERDVHVKARSDEPVRFLPCVVLRIGGPALHVDQDQGPARIEPGVFFKSRQSAGICTTPARPVEAGRQGAIPAWLPTGLISTLSQNAKVGASDVASRGCRSSGCATSGGEYSSCSRPSAAPADQMVASRMLRSPWVIDYSLRHGASSGSKRRHLQVDAIELGDAEVMAEEARRMAERARRSGGS